MNLKRALMLPLAFALVFTGQSAALAGHGKKANSGDPDNANHYVDRNDMSLTRALQWRSDLVGGHGR